MRSHALQMNVTFVYILYTGIPFKCTPVAMLSNQFMEDAFLLYAFC